MLIPTLLLAALAPQISTHDTAAPLPTLDTIPETGNTLFLDEPGDGRTWARGATYKASFGPEGFTYRPFLGSDAPQSYPLTLDLRRVTVAELALPLARRERTRIDRAVDLDRGTVRETYFIEERQVEQTFVFDQLAHRGEIVLTLDVSTELESSPASGGGFHFTGPLGGVHYGAATAYDARGASVPLLQRRTADAIEITVPAEFVRAAELPLVVDPVLSTFGVTDDTRRQLETDVAYDAQNDIYQIVWSEVESSLDIDMFCSHYDHSTGGIIDTVSIDLTTESWYMPRNANAYEAQQFLCVSVVGNLIGSRRVWGRTRDADTGARGPQFPISGFGAEYVDVGGKGNSILTAYDYMVVWQEADTINQDFDIVAQAVESDSTLTAGRITIDGDVGDMDRFPSISKTSGRPSSSNADNEYMITWEREVGTDNRNLRCQVIEYTGSMLGHNQFSGYTFSDSRRPDVSTSSRFNTIGGERYWVIVFERRTGTDYDIFGIVARDGFADNARSIPVMQDLDQPLDHRSPKICNDGADFLVAYRTEISSTEDRVYMTSVNVVHDDGELRLGLSLRRDSIARSFDATPEYGITTTYDGGGLQTSQSAGLLAWVARPQNSDAEVDAAIVADFAAPVVGSQYCDANPNSTGTSAWIRAFAALASISPLAGDPITLNCTDLPSNSFGHFLCSTQSGFIANPAGSAGNLCLQGSIGRFNRAGEVMNSGPGGSFGLTVDSSAFPSPTGLVSAVSGQAWFFQTWFRDLGPTSNFSNGVEVRFD